MRGYLLGVALGLALLATVAAPIGRTALGHVSFAAARWVELQAIRHLADWDGAAWWRLADDATAVNNRINGP